MAHIELLKAAWYGDVLQRLQVPESWSLSRWGKENYSGTARSGMAGFKDTDFGVSEAIQGLLSTIKDRRSCGTIGVVIDDMTRPTPAHKILQPLLQALQDLGNDVGAVHLFPAVGGHRPLTAVDLKKKVGLYVLNKVVVHHHSPFVGNTLIGTTPGGLPVWVNSAFIQCDYKILVGTVLPHSAVGISGGLKLVVPGLAGIETIISLHSAKFKGAYPSPENEKRYAIDSVRDMLEVDYAVYVITNPDRTLAAVFHGDPLAAHKDASAYVLAEATVEVAGTYDIGILSAYPLDTEFVQAGKALDIARHNPEMFSRQASLVVCVSATEGIGFHILRTPGFIAPFDDDWTIAYGEKELIFFSTNINAGALPKSCREKIKIFSSWARLRQYLVGKHGENINVGIFPYPTVQIISASDVKLV